MNNYIENLTGINLIGLLVAVFLLSVVILSLICNLGDLDDPEETQLIRMFLNAYFIFTGYCYGVWIS